MPQSETVDGPKPGSLSLNPLQFERIALALVMLMLSAITVYAIVITATKLVDSS
jgi:hypothetical protein